MTLVFPKDRAAAATRAALDRAFFLFAVVLLGAGGVGTVIASIAEPGHPLWLALASLAVLFSLGWLVGSGRSRAAWTILLATPVAVAALWGFASTLDGSPLVDAGAGSFFLSSACVALVMFATVADRWAGGWAGALIGYALSSSSVMLAQLQQGLPVTLDVPVLTISVGTVGALAFLAFSRSRARRNTSDFSAASHDDSTDHERSVLQQQSTALIHDTILNELAALASTPAGQLPAASLRQIRSSVALAQSADLAQDSPSATPGGALRETLARFSELGLTVNLAGDIRALDALPTRTAQALRQAVDQCLVNVLRHSGADTAEVVVMASPTELSVMVIDDGVGFDETAVPADRLGLRSSVRARIATVGGRVDLWSRPGNGTSIIISVPLGDAATR